MARITEYEATERYNEMLNECYSLAEVAGYTYAVSHLFKMVDPIAYRTGLADYIDSMGKDDGTTVEGYE